MMVLTSYDSDDYSLINPSIVGEILGSGLDILASSSFHLNAGA